MLTENMEEEDRDKLNRSCGVGFGKSTSWQCICILSVEKDRQIYLFKGKNDLETPYEQLHTSSDNIENDVW